MGLHTGTCKPTHRHVTPLCPRTREHSHSHRHTTRPHSPPSRASDPAGPPQVLRPALPKAFTNCFLEISRRLWCSFSLTQETAQQFCFSKSGTHKPGSFLRFFHQNFPWPGAFLRGLGLEVILRAPSAGHHLLNLVDNCREGKEGTCIRLNCFTDGETESGGGSGQRGAVGSCRACARFCDFFHC